MESRQSEEPRAARFARYIEARRFDPPRPLLIKAVALADQKEHALDGGAGALNATKYLLSAGFAQVTALDAAPRAREDASELADDRATFMLSRLEAFNFPANRYDQLHAEFSLPVIPPGRCAP